MNELELIVGLHRHTHRQGPGSDADTHRALDFVELSNMETVADIGCGTGVKR